MLEFVHFCVHRFICSSYLFFICRMDEKIWIVAPNTRGRGYCLSKVVDADFTKPPSALIKLWMLTSPSLQADFNIQVCSNQDLLEMFGKHEASKCCLLTVCYHSPGSEPPDIPDWDFSTGQSVEAPFTPSIPCPSSRTKPPNWDSICR